MGDRSPKAMAKFLWALSLLAICVQANTVHPPAHSQRDSNSNNLLSAQLKPVHSNSDVSTSDGELKIIFVVKNPTGSSVKLLKRWTPLDTTSSNMFEVKNAAGQVMNYRGLDAKRLAEPNENEWVTVEAGGSIERETLIGGEYQLDGDGAYTISMLQMPMNTQLDVSEASTTVTVTGTALHEDRNKQRTATKMAHAKQLLARRSTSTVATDSCSSSQISNVQNMNDDAYDKIQAARQCTTSSCSSIVNTWFGPSTTSAQLTTVTEKFDTMSTRFTQSIYKCVPDCTSGSSGCVCSGGTYAYVYPTDTTQTIYLCNLAIDYPDYAERVQTVIHELSHFDYIASTSDNTYGEQPCYLLANGDSASFTSASTCADSFAYFGIYVNTCYREYSSPTTSPNPYTAATPPCQSCAASSTYPYAGNREAISCGASAAPTALQPTQPPTAIDSCQYANDDVCDEPSYCYAGTDCSDCANCVTGTPTSATANQPTSAQPTSAPTYSTYSAAFLLTLQGVDTTTAFTTAQKSGFQTVIANAAGMVCGYAGTERCSGDTDVTLKSFVRRGSASVSFTLDTYSDTKANTALATLRVYVETTTFTNDLATAGSVTATSSTIVTSEVTEGSTSGYVPAPWGGTNGATTMSAFSLTAVIFVLVKYFI